MVKKNWNQICHVDFRTIRHAAHDNAVKDKETYSSFHRDHQRPYWIRSCCNKDDPDGESNIGMKFTISISIILEILHMHIIRKKKKSQFSASPSAAILDLVILALKMTLNDEDDIGIEFGIQFPVLLEVSHVHI